MDKAGGKLLPLGLALLLGSGVATNAFAGAGGGGGNSSAAAAVPMAVPVNVPAEGGGDVCVPDARVSDPFCATVLRIVRSLLSASYTLASSTSALSPEGSEEVAEIVFAIMQRSRLGPQG